MPLHVALGQFQLFSVMHVPSTRACRGNARHSTHLKPFSCIQHKKNKCLCMWHWANFSCFLSRMSDQLECAARGNAHHSTHLKPFICIQHKKNKCLCMRHWANSIVLHGSSVQEQLMSPLHSQKKPYNCIQHKKNKNSICPLSCMALVCRSN